MNIISWKKLPDKPGVYLFKNDSGKVIYVGKAKDLKKRVSSYFANKALDAKTLQMVSEATLLDHIIVGSEVEAFFLESLLIKKHKPYFNIKLSDDKSFPLLMISSSNKHKVPYLSIVRKKEDKNAKYFGPYLSAYDLKIVLRLLRRIFPYQSVKNHPPKRCLYSHIGLCPCIPIFPERLPEYKDNIRHIVAFFSGGQKNILSDLLKQQKIYVNNEEFEKAGLVQKKIDKINFITSKNYDPFKYEEKPDFYFERIRAETESLSQILLKYGLNVGSLHRIECYDVSNIQGKNATGSMVVFQDGDAFKSGYRRFRIKHKRTPDDFAMLKEVIERRFKQGGWGKPDLMVIDGGKGQVSSVMQVLASKNVNINVIGLAKKEETIVIPVKTGLGLDFLMVKLAHSTPGVNLLRRIRDEAHRFAISYHRLLRKKNSKI